MFENDVTNILLSLQKRFSPFLYSSDDAQENDADNGDVT